MSVNELLRSSRLSWLAASGKESDVVLSSRIRLARNFREIPFPNAHVRAGSKQPKTRDRPPALHYSEPKTKS